MAAVKRHSLERLPPIQIAEKLSPICYTYALESIMLNWGLPPTQGQGKENVNLWLTFFIRQTN